MSRAVWVRGDSVIIEQEYTELRQHTAILTILQVHSELHGTAWIQKPWVQHLDEETMYVKRSRYARIKRDQN